ncbi:MAG: hypothetical protein CMJ78_22735 [Planctomycetaceae bacterium]|nr:hypothetical protein [Planctomycetaceae bacterium]
MSLESCRKNIIQLRSKHIIKSWAILRLMNRHQFAHDFSQRRSRQVMSQPITQVAHFFRHVENENCHDSFCATQSRSFDLAELAVL